MAYIGQSPSIGNFQVCDAISVVNGQAAYTMQVSSVNVVPETANHMIVSLNGIIQKPGSSYTVSGSTITFASNLATGDVIDFIHILGSVLDLGVPSDDTVSTAKISANAVTAAKFNADVISGQTALAEEPADTDEFLVSDAGVLKRIDYSLIKGGGMHTLLSTTTVSSAVSEVDIFSNIDSTYKRYVFHLIDLQPSTNAAHLYLRVKPDGKDLRTGSQYGYSGIFHGSDDGSATFGTRRHSNGQSYVELTNEVGSGDEEKLQGEVHLFNPASTTNDYRGMWTTVSSRGDNVTEHQGVWRFDRAGLPASADQALVGIRFYFSSGNIAGGIIKLYGVT
jgi:hypothetical protein